MTVRPRGAFTPALTLSSNIESTETTNHLKRKCGVARTDTVIVLGLQPWEVALWDLEP
jgi:hypothetical protein